LNNKLVKGLVFIAAAGVVFLIGLMFGYSYIENGFGGVFRFETWYNFMHQLRNFLT